MIQIHYGTHLDVSQVLASHLISTDNLIATLISRYRCLIDSYIYCTRILIFFCLAKRCQAEVEFGFWVPVPAER